MKNTPNIPRLQNLSVNAYSSYWQSWAYCAEERKSASFFFVAPQHKLRLSKAQLRSLRLKILDATFNHNFYDWIWYGET
jgi:hypothetical protein